MAFERYNDEKMSYAETICSAHDVCKMLDSCDLCPFVYDDLELGYRKCVYSDPEWPNSSVYKRLVKVRLSIEEMEDK